MSTLFVLLACLVWLGRRQQRLHIIALAACCVAGLLAKESAVALVPLLAMLAIMASPDDGPDGRRQIETLAISSVAVIAVLIARSAWTSSLAGHLATFPSDRRAVKDLVLRPFAGLVTPVSTDRGLGPIVYVIGLVAIGLLVMILVEHWRNRQTGPPGRQPRLAGTVVAIAWIAIGSLPLLGTLFVAPTLEGGRYLYLPAVGFSFFIGAAASQTGRTGAIGIAAVVALWLLYMPSMQERRHVWLEAAGMRDALLTQARALVLADRCGTLHVDDAPDSVRGAFVFRVGLTDALSDMPYTARGPDCTARWSQTRLVPRAE